MTKEVISVIEDREPPYPGLKYHNENGVEWWEGQFSFTALFDSIRVKDQFTIRIELPSKPHRFPKVREIGGRTDTIFTKWQSRGKIKEIADLHVNPDGFICFCPKPEENRKSTQPIEIRGFINEFVIPYFFALSKFEKTGKWIWGEYSHGDFGILEYYLDHRNGGDVTLLDDCLNTLKMNPTKRQLNGKERCDCGSGVKLKKCHRKAFEGYKAIVQDLKQRQQK